MAISFYFWSTILIKIKKEFNMKKNMLLYMLIFLNILFSEVKIGYVDSQQVMIQYEGFRTVQIELEKEQKPLEIFGRDLTLAAQNGELDPVIGRDKEIKSAIKIVLIILLIFIFNYPLVGKISKKNKKLAFKTTQIKEKGRKIFQPNRIN